MLNRETNYLAKQFKMIEELLKQCGSALNLHLIILSFLTLSGISGINL
jgi:hypothetical protein